MSEGSRSVRGATRDDVARLAGVSSAVVSYVVNDGPRPVAPATRAKVLDAIEKLGYQPNAAARSLITGRSDLVGLLVPDIGNAYFAALAEAVETAARARGLDLILAQCRSEELPRMVDSLSGRNVVGIITATLPPPSFGQGRLRVPIVKLSLALPLDAIPSMWPDYAGGIRAAVRHLIEVHGHREIALVTGSEHLDERERAWRDTLEQAGLAARRVVRVDWSAEAGAAAAGILRERHPEVTAVQVASDQQAIGFLSGLHRLGCAVPGDLAVTSFDGSPDAQFAIPALTTVSVPLSDMARDGIAELLGAPRPERTYPATLVVRESCGCPPRE